MANGDLHEERVLEAQRWAYTANADGTTTRTAAGVTTVYVTFIEIGSRTKAGQTVPKVTIKGVRCDNTQSTVQAVFTVYDENGALLAADFAVPAGETFSYTLTNPQSNRVDGGYTLTMAG